MPVQWAHLGGDGVLVASSRGAWIQRPELGPFGMHGPLGLTGPMPNTLPSTEETTRHLLDGAIAAAERAGPALKEPLITALRWAWHLVSQWHCAHHSVALLPALIERFQQMERPDLAEFARRKLEEEHGHDEFPLADLAALGYDAESVVREVPPAAAVTAALEYARSCTDSDEPVEFLGYAYALERRVLSLTSDWFVALDAVLPQSVDAASGVRAHANGLDTDHVDEAVAFITGLPAEDRTAIAIGCYRTTKICCAWTPGQIPTDAELESRLSRFQHIVSRAEPKGGNE